MQRHRLFETSSSWSPHPPASIAAALCWDLLARMCAIGCWSRRQKPRQRFHLADLSRAGSDANRLDDKRRTERRRSCPRTAATSRAWLAQTDLADLRQTNRRAMTPTSKRRRAAITMTKPVFTDDEEQLPLLTEKRNRCATRACTMRRPSLLPSCSAVSSRVAGSTTTGANGPGPSLSSRSSTPKSWRGAEAFPAIAMIHGSGRHGGRQEARPRSHRVRNTDEEDLLHSLLGLGRKPHNRRKRICRTYPKPGVHERDLHKQNSRVSRRVPLIWKAVEALAQSSSRRTGLTAATAPSGKRRFRGL